MNGDTSDKNAGRGTVSRKRKSALGSAVWRVVRLVLIAYVAVNLFLYFFQRRLQYFPDTANPSLPPGASGLEEFTTTTDDGVEIKGWYWPGPKPLTIDNWPASFWPKISPNTAGWNSRPNCTAGSRAWAGSP